MKKLLIGVAVCFGLIVAMLAFFIFAMPTEPTFAFVKADHPIDIWQDGKDRWAYFAADKGSTKDLADMARKELIGQGYSEVKTGQAWFRFKKGDQEVVICNHSEFAVNGSPLGSKLELHQAIDKNQWPCVLVMNGPGTSGSVAGFQVKKLVLRW